MTIVLDGSMCLAWCFEDERTPEVLAVFEQVVEEGGLVPPIWRYEVANALLMAQRRKRIDAEQRIALLQTLSELDVEEDRAPEGNPWRATVQLADLHRLTVYDASYLELAQRRRVRLATLDQALIGAAREAGMAIVGDC